MAWLLIARLVVLAGVMVLMLAPASPAWACVVIAAGVVMLPLEPGARPRRDFERPSGVRGDARWEGYR